MQKEKYCPKCLKLVDGKTSKCPQCGYEFVEVIEEDEEVTNAVQLHDPVPAIVWKATGFICPIAGLVLYLIWKNDRPQRAKDAGKSALSMGIFWVSVLVLYVIYVVFKSKGLIV